MARCRKRPGSLRADEASVEQVQRAMLLAVLRQLGRELQEVKMLQLQQVSPQLLQARVALVEGETDHADEGESTPESTPAGSRRRRRPRRRRRSRRRSRPAEESSIGRAHD